MRDVRVRDVPMRNVPVLVGRTGDVRTGGKDAQAEKTLSHPCLFSLFPFCFLSLLAFLLPKEFPFGQLDTINNLNLRSIQIFHLSYSTPLCKTQMVNHYLRIEYFQHKPYEAMRVMAREDFGPGVGSGTQTPLLSQTQAHRVAGAKTQSSLSRLSDRLVRVQLPGGKAKHGGSILANGKAGI